MIIIHNKKAEEILSEINARLERLEVKGDSVEHLFYIKLGMRQLFENSEQRNEDSDKKESQERKK